MLCSLSGQIPVEPVASLKSGHVFEKRLLLKYLAQNQQRCPVTGDALDVDTDLLALQPPTASSTSTNSSTTSNGTANAFSPESASIPQLLSLFQSEWDGVVLETFTLRKHLDKTRQELSHALYQHDAACRVIARLNDENAALRTKLAARVTPAAAAAASDDVVMAVTNTLSPDAIAAIEAKQKALATDRKAFKKTIAPALAAKLAGLNDWSAASTLTLHDADKPGVLCVDVDHKNPMHIVTGGVDKTAKVFDVATGEIVATLGDHTKKVSAATFHPTAELVVTASHDKTVKLWRADTSEVSFSVAHTFEGHTDAVTAVSVHATGDFVLSASTDATWGVHDLRTGQLLARYGLDGEAVSDGRNGPAANAVLTAAFHPDGGIFGTGSTTKQLQMWDIKSLANVATFDGHNGHVAALSFSENGYQLASGSTDGIVKFWDLRKLKSYCEVDVNALSTIGMSKPMKASGIQSLQYDASGTHVAVAAGPNVHVLKETGKTAWTPVKTWHDHKATATGVCFAPDNSFVATVSMDRSLKLYR